MVKSIYLLLSFRKAKKDLSAVSVSDKNSKEKKILLDFKNNLKFIKIRWP